MPRKSIPIVRVGELRDHRAHSVFRPSLRFNCFFSPRRRSTRLIQKACHSEERSNEETWLDRSVGKKAQVSSSLPLVDHLATKPGFLGRRRRGLGITMKRGPPNFSFQFPFSALRKTRARFCSARNPQLRACGTRPRKRCETVRRESFSPDPAGFR